MTGTRRRSSRAFQAAIALVIGLVAVAVVAGFWVSTRPAEQKIVHLGSFSTAIDYAPYLIARHQGWLGEGLRRAGYKADYVEFQTLPSINEALATNNADVVFEAEPPAIIGNSNGLRIKIHGISCSLIQQIIVPADSGKRSIGDLKGARIAVLAGTSSHYGLVRDLQEVGISPSDVSIIDMTPPNAKAAFETRQMDAWAVWPPFVEQELLAKRTRVLNGGDARINSIYVMRDDFVTSDPAAAQVVSKVISDTKRWMVAYPDEAEQIVASEMQLPLDVVKLAWPKHNFSASLSDAVVTDIQAKADFLVQQQLIRSSVNVSRDLIAR